MLECQGELFIYGPFNYQGQYTSKSNEDFDHYLQSKDPLSAIRHFEAIVELDEQAALPLVNDYTMPANNRLLHFIKIE